MSRGSRRKSGQTPGQGIGEILAALSGAIRGDPDPWKTVHPVAADALRVAGIEHARQTDVPAAMACSRLAARIDDLAEDGAMPALVSSRSLARFIMFCSGCEEWSGSRCALRPDLPLERSLERRIFCPGYRPAGDRGMVLPRNEVDLTLGPPRLLILSVILLVPALLLLVLLRLLRWALWPPKWAWRQTSRAARSLARGLRGGLGLLRARIFHLGARLRDRWNRIADVVQAIRDAVSGPPAGAPATAADLAPAADLTLAVDLQAAELAESLEEVRREAERARADLRDREAWSAELGARITELENRLTRSQEELKDVSKRAATVGRLARQQQEILDGKARSARRLAVGRRRLRKHLEEAAGLIPDDAIVSSEGAAHVEELLEAAESALEDREEELASAQADLAEALAELETYDQHLAIAAQRIRDLETAPASRAGRKQPPEPVPVLPRRIADTDILQSPRFSREFDALPTYLRPFVAARLRLLIEHPDALDRRAFRVDEADRSTYRLPAQERLRKCRLNVKYRLFLVLGDHAVHLVSVAPHA